MQQQKGGNMMATQIRPPPNISQCPQLRAILYLVFVVCQYVFFYGIKISSYKLWYPIKTIQYLKKTDMIFHRHVISTTTITNIICSNRRDLCQNCNPAMTDPDIYQGYIVCGLCKVKYYI